MFPTLGCHKGHFFCLGVLRYTGSGWGVIRYISHVGMSYMEYLTLGCHKIHWLTLGCHKGATLVAHGIFSHFCFHKVYFSRRLATMIYIFSRLVVMTHFCISL